MEYNAIVRFLSKEEGGRIIPPMSGYRPHMKIGEKQTSCFIVPKDNSIEVMQFGKDHEVLIKFQYEEMFKEQIKSGLNIGLYEGKKLVGHGYML